MKPIIHTAYLGLGSNLTNDIGSPVEHVMMAINRIKENNDIHDVIVSSLYLSKPHGVTDQPDFINAVVSIKTVLSAHDLLKLCQSLEQLAQRRRLRHWGERSLDVDVLLYDEITLCTKELSIPHPELHKRNFVLIPLIEIAPDLKIQNMTISEMPMSQDWTGLSLYSVA